MVDIYLLNLNTCTMSKFLWSSLKSWVLWTQFILSSFTTTWHVKFAKLWPIRPPWHTLEHTPTLYLISTLCSYFLVFLGITLAVMGEKGKPLMEFFICLSEAMMTITTWVIYMAPVGVFFLIGGQVRTHHMFLRILNFIFVVVFSKKSFIDIL